MRFNICFFQVLGSHTFGLCSRAAPTHRSEGPVGAREFGEDAQGLRSAAAQRSIGSSCCNSAEPPGVDMTIHMTIQNIIEKQYADMTIQNIIEKICSSSEYQTQWTDFVKGSHEYLSADSPTAPDSPCSGNALKWGLPGFDRAGNAHKCSGWCNHCWRPQWWVANHHSILIFHNMFLGKQHCLRVKQKSIMPEGDASAADW